MCFWYRKGGLPGCRLSWAYSFQVRGTNLQALIDCIDNGSLDATIELVVSSRPSAQDSNELKLAGHSRFQKIYADPLTADMVMRQSSNVWALTMGNGRYMRKVGMAL